MDMNLIVGNIAAMLTTVSFLPQAIKAIKTKDTESLSLPMYAMFVAGVVLWIVYGLQNNQLPIILGNIVTLLFAGIILGYKLRETFRLKQKRARA